MESPIRGLDSREFALLVWIAFGLVASLFSKKLRSSIGGVSRSLLSWKLLLTFGAMVLYIAGIVWLLSLADLWRTNLVSETTFWWLFVGLPLLFRAVNAGSQDDFFKKAALLSIGWTALLEFVVNLPPFNVVVEVVMVLPLLLLFGALAYSQATDPASHTSGVLLGLGMSVVLFFIGYTVVGMVSNPRDFFTYVTLLEFLVPILLTLGVIPFVYMFALLTTYGSAFMRLNWKLDKAEDASIRRYAKWRVLRAGNLHLKRAHRFASKGAWRIASDDDRTAVDLAVRNALLP